MMVQRRRILIVDDDSYIIQAVQMLLASEGYDVRASATGADTLVLARTFQPDLILTDLDMPDMDGFALARTLKSDPETRSIPVVALSARESKELVCTPEAGFAGSLSKPIDPRTLPGLILPFLPRRKEPTDW